MKRLWWLLTVAALVFAVALLPRLAPEPGTDVFVSNVGVGERAALRGGAVEVTGVTVSPQYADGDEIHTLADGVFVEVRAVIRPDKVASSITMTVESDGRSFKRSDLSAPVERGEPGFDTPITVLFEVPRDVIGDGQVRVSFTSHSAAAVAIDEGSSKRVHRLEAS